VADFGGRLTAHNASDEGGGAVFELELPLPILGKEKDGRRMTRQA
jgi:two-component system C4-dicarboxylate transport sensor histidine kinase DctB